MSRFKVKVGTDLEIIEISVQELSPITINVNVGETANKTVKKSLAVGLAFTVAAAVSASAIYGVNTGDYTLLKELANVAKDLIAVAAKAA